MCNNDCGKLERDLRRERERVAELEEEARERRRREERDMEEARERRRREERDMEQARAARERRRREQWDMEQARADRKQAARDAERDAERDARTWPEAFRKQRALLGRELAVARDNLNYAETDGNPVLLDDARADVAEIESDMRMMDWAQVAWSAEEGRLADELAALRSRQREAVLARLLAEFGEAAVERQNLKECFEADRPEKLLDW